MDKDNEYHKVYAIISVYCEDIEANIEVKVPIGEPVTLGGTGTKELLEVKPNIYPALNFSGKKPTGDVNIKLTTLKASYDNVPSYKQCDWYIKYIEWQNKLKGELVNETKNKN